MIIEYIIQIVISISLSYLLFRFFNQKLKYSLIFVFLTIFLLNFVFGLFGNSILLVYIIFGFILKFYYKKHKLEKLPGKIIRFFLLLFLIIGVFGFILKIILNRENIDIVIKIISMVFWTSLLLIFIELKNRAKVNNFLSSIFHKSIGVYGKDIR